MSKKKNREIIYNKFNGRCAYCCVDLQKGWHVDEMLPVRRNFKRNPDTMARNQWIFDGTYEHPERFHIDNQVPSCPSCNINKHSMSVDEFRALIFGFITSLNRDSTQYKIAKRYGLISENIKSVVFLFEEENH